MESLSLEQRQLMACGFAPRVEVSRAWTPPSWPHKERPTTCAGYTTKLPEVQEVAYARLHWSKGSLRDAFPRPTEQLLHAIVELEVAVNETERWSFDNPVKQS